MDVEPHASLSVAWAVQYVVETRFTGHEHEVSGAAQQQVVGHQERIISGPPPSMSSPPHPMAPQVHSVVLAAGR